MSLFAFTTKFGFAATLATSITLQGCGASFEPATPPGFIELEEPGSYDYRATTADGLVIAARELDNPSKGELAFWSRAIENQLRNGSGYALLEIREIESKDGVPGAELRFGHDQGNTPHLYYVALFATSKKLCLVEVGGPKDTVVKNAARVEWAISEFKVD